MKVVEGLQLRCVIPYCPLPSRSTPFLLLCCVLCVVCCINMAGVPPQVHLGFSVPIDEKYTMFSEFLPSKIGGQPVWSGATGFACYTLCIDAYLQS
jgi:hypothetical protein